MNITPVINGTNTGFSPLSDNNAIKILEKQKTQLQDQIQKTGQSKLDDKSKQEKIKELQEQIRQIDTQIQQKRTEMLNKSNGKANAPADSQISANDNAGNGPAGMNDLVQAASSYTNAKLINNAKDKMEGNKRVINMEIKLDGFTTGFREKNLQSIDAKIESLDDKFGDEIQASCKHMKESAKQENNRQSGLINNGNNDEKDFALSPSVHGDAAAETVEAIPVSGNERDKSRESAENRPVYAKVDIKI